MNKYIIPFVFIFSLVSCSSDSDTSSYASKKDSSQDYLYNLLLSSDTNLDFENNVVESNEENYLNYEFIYNGSGVAVGDINNDGLTDIYFGGNSVGDKLYLNKGNLKFEDISVSSGISTLIGWSTGINMVDINQDGWLDIYVCRSGPSKDVYKRTNRLFINNKDNTFTEAAAQYGLNAATYSIQSAFFDYDLDGDLDMYLLNHPDPNFKTKQSREHMQDILSGKIRTDIFFENIDGKFVDKTLDAKLYNFGYRHGIAVGDVNKDGYPDLFVSSDFEEPDALFINNGDKTFTNDIHRRLGHISYNSMGNELSDVNNDGELDLFVVDMAPDDHYRSKLYMASMDVARFRNLQANGYHNQYMFNTLNMNNSNGTFSEVGQYAGLAKSDWSWGPLFFDMDLDGYKDLIITNGIKENFSYRDLQKDINTTTNGTGQIDINGLLEIVPSEISENQIYKNKDGIKFENKTKKWWKTGRVNSNGIASADFDNDGDMDFVTNNMLAKATLYESKAVDQKLGNYIKIILKGKAGNINAIGAKVEVVSALGTQLTEIHRAKGYISAIDLPVIFGLGSDATASVQITWPDNTITTHPNLQVNQSYVFEYGQSSAEPLTKPSKKPLLKRTNAGLDFVHNEDSYDDYKQQILLPHSQSTVGPATAKGDVNGDGLEDVYVGGAYGQAAMLYVQNSDGTFSTSSQNWSKDRNFEDTGATFFDADQDGDLDLYVVSGGAHFPEFHQLYEDRLYINNGQGVFYRSALPKGTNISGQAVAVSDVDADGDLDLFVGGRLIPEKYPYAPESFMLINQGGTFSKQTMALDNLVSSATFTDVDGDGDEDLVTLGEWSPIIVMENNGGTFTQQNNASLKNSRGLWFGLASADIDGDGDMDLFAGNLGLNAKFKANDKKKFQVYCTDFDNNGSYDVVLSTNYKDYDVPTRGRECSSQQMPFIAEEFQDYHSFASASLQDIYGEGLNNALNKQIDVLHSAYLENDGSGNFNWVQLPPASQMAPLQDFEFIDLDGDGQLEVLTVGDLYNVEVETERYDASIGAVLKKTDTGFKYWDKQETGFIGMGDARKVIKVSGSSGDQIILSNNNGPIEVFQLQ